MSRPRIQIISHLDYSELTRQYEECQDETVKNYWLAIQLLSHPETPLTVGQVAEVLGFSADWVRKVARRYNHLGPASLIKNSHPRRRRGSPHSRPTLSKITTFNLNMRD